MTVHLLNSAMMPTEGDYCLRSVTAEQWGMEAGLALREGRAVSSIGYPDTARILSDLAEFEVPVSRNLTRVVDGDILLVARLPYRVDPNTKGAPRATSAADFEFYRATFKSPL